MDRQKLDISFLLEELTNKVTNIFNTKLLESFDISYSEWKLLFAVFLAQDNPEQEEIAKHAGKSPAAVSRQLNILEEKGLVSRATSKDSKRIKYVKLTKEGKNVFNKALIVVSKHSKAIFDVLKDDKDPFKVCLIDLLNSLDNVHNS